MPQTPRASTRAQIGVELEEPNTPQQQLDPEPHEEPESQRPDWLPENFQDERAFLQSYRSLEDELRRRGEEQNRLSAQISELSEMIEERNAQTPQWQQPQNEQQLREQLQVAFDNDPIGTMAWMAQQYSTQTIDARLQALQEESRPNVQQQTEQQNQLLAMTVDRALQDRHDDWNEYKPKVAEAIEQDPALLSPEYLANPEATMRQLERIYENVKAREVLQAAQDGNFVTHELRGMKQRSQTLSGAGHRPGEPTADEEKIAALMEAAKGMSYSSWREG